MKVAHINSSIIFDPAFNVNSTLCAAFTDAAVLRSRDEPGKSIENVRDTVQLQ